jgi:hypothetical protein
VKGPRLRADFNGLFGDVVCLSHDETCQDETGRAVHVHAGMQATAFDEDSDDSGARDDLVAIGIVEPSPPWLTCSGSKWVLRIDAKGVRHQSEINEADD